jgi:hypothetical protein
MPDRSAIEQLIEALFEQADRGDRAAKKNFAERLSRLLAQLFAGEMSSMFPNARVTPRADGTAQEYRIGGDIDAKKTDVAVWDDRAGLVVGVSIKTITARDPKTQRYTKNVLRNDMELRDEADKLHRRQPYAFLVAVVFLPLDSTWDGRGATAHSSFAHAVFSFRKRTARTSPDALRYDLFERVFVGLLDHGQIVGFHDVIDAPPRNQPPGSLLSIDELVARIVAGAKLRHFGRTEDRFAEDDPDWLPPTPPTD